MNIIFRAKSYSWDTACPNVKFVREGHVFSSNKLLKSGSYEQLSENLKNVAPNANTFIVSGVNCEGYVAAGCGPIGGEPEIVGASWPGYDAQIWLHERGHNMGLQHSAEGPDDDDQVSQDVGMRIMFWHLGIGHNGKTAQECETFKALTYASETSQTISAAMPPGRKGLMQSASQTVKNTTGPDNTGLTAPATPPSIVSTAGEASYPDFKEQQDQAAKTSGLTPKAFRVVGAPWVEGHPPVKQIRELDPDDIHSIRNLFKGPPNQYWQASLNTLALIGTASDADLIKRALNKPLPAVPPGGLDAFSIQQRRYDLAAKAAAPQALGILAKRTDSVEAIQTLHDELDLKKAAKIVGKDSARELSTSALKSLQASGSEKGQETVQKVLQASEARTSSGVAHSGSTATVQLQLNSGNPHLVTVPLLSPNEAKQLRAGVASPKVDALLKPFQ
jgi:hypothetical protein